jgi:hypothetical protein
MFGEAGQQRTGQRGAVCRSRRHNAEVRENHRFLRALIFHRQDIATQ